MIPAAAVEPRLSEPETLACKTSVVHRDGVSDAYQSDAQQGTSSIVVNSAQTGKAIALFE